MKNKTTIILLFVSSIIYSQDLKMCGYQGYQTVDEINSACEFQGSENTGANVTQAENTVDGILEKIGLFRNFFIEECENINNAIAVTMPADGGAIERYILYDQQFFTKVSTTTGTNWGNTSILAHEVGHHLNGHTLNNSGSNHRVELQADEFSGFVLARMGCSLEDAQSAVSNLLPDEASATHPAKQDRLNAIAKGWNRGSGKIIKVKKIEDVPENNITAEMVLAKYIDAIGGEEKLRTFKSHKRVMKIKLENLGTVSSTYTYLTPQIYKTETNSVEMLFNKGKIKGAGQKMSLNQNTNFTSYIEEYAELIANRNVTYLGEETVNGETCYKLQFANTVTEVDNPDINFKMKIDSERFRYYLKSTGLLIKTEDIMHQETIINNAKPTKTKSVNIQILSNYQDRDGILVPLRYDGENKTEGNTSKFITEITKYEVNPALDPADFEID